MKKLSLSDRKFLAACKISTAVERFTDAAFLRACGVAVEPTFDAERMELAKRIAKHPAPLQLDGTCQALLSLGLPLTAENWMRLQFAGDPPAVGEVDGEVLAECPRWVRAFYDPDYDPEDEEEDI
jgi:hypothetical protein